VAIPGWANWLIALALAGIAVFYIVRLLAGVGTSTVRPSGSDRSGDLAHALMAAGMVAMLLSLDRPLTSRDWLVIFIADAAWFALLLVRHSFLIARDSGPSVAAPAATAARRLHHVVANLAMVYMLSVTSRSAMGTMSSSTMDMTGMAMPGGMPRGLPVPPLAWAVVVYFLGYTAWSLTCLAIRTRRGQDSGVTEKRHPAWQQPRVFHVCHAVMGAAMATMLLAML
jgi:hypothetical protein